ncbi:hypothetical protein M3Y99_01089100 [Aphelenchoides fujianensis]|nr:hypothetical protein M3Y99_01089100 [Aphelenchoides fujianensis]
MKNWEAARKTSGHEMQKLLGLLLGAAVHHSDSPAGECMSAESEAEIIAELAQITGNRDLLLKLNPNEPSALPDPEAIRRLLESLAEERNEYAIRLLKMAEERAEGASTSSSNGLRTPSPSGSIDRDRLAQLQDENAELQKQLELKSLQSEHNRQAALDYEDRLDVAHKEVADLKRELDEQKEETSGLREKIRSFNDTFKHLEYENKRLQKADEDRRKLLVEKEKWVRAQEEHSKVQKEYEKLRSSLSNLKANERLCEELKQQNGALTFELSQVRNELKTAQLGEQETQKKLERLVDEKRKLEAENESFARRSASFANDSAAADAPGLNLTLEAELQQAEIEHLREENERLQLELAKAAQPEELQRLRGDLTNVRTEFDRLAAAKSALERQLEAQVAEANRTADELRELQRVRGGLEGVRSELESRTAELSAAHLRQGTTRGDRQRAGGSRRKSSLQNIGCSLISCFQLRAAERSVADHVDRLQRAEAERTKAEERAREQAAKSQATAAELRRLADELRAAREQSERERKAAETERTALSMRLDELEEERGQLKAQMIDQKQLQRRVAKADEELLERNTRIQELEVEVARLRKQLEIEAANTQELRDQLAAERARHAGLMPRLRSIYVAYCTTKSGGEDAKLPDDAALLNSIDSCLRDAFDQHLAAAAQLRVEQQMQIEEINKFSKNIDDLKRKGDELNATDDRTSQRMKGEVELYKERLNAAHQRENELHAKVAVERRKVEDLQRQVQQNVKVASELSRLQVEQQSNERELRDLKAEYLELEQRAAAAVATRKEAAQKLAKLQLANEALDLDYERLKALHNSVTVDFDRTKHEAVELKRKLRLLNDAAAESGRERSLKAEEEAARLQRELKETRREHAALIRQKEATADELRGLRETTATQKSALSALNSTIQQLNVALGEKEAALAKSKSNGHFETSNGRAENGNFQRQVELLLQRNADLHRSAEQTQQVRRLQETAERNQVEASRLLRRPVKPPSTKPLARRNGKSGTIAERTSDSNTDDSSIYSAEETQLPSPPLEALARTNGILGIHPPIVHNGIRGDSVRITPTSSDRGSGESIGSDFEHPHFAHHPAKTGSIESQQSDTYASIASVGPFRPRNSPFGGSLCYRRAARPPPSGWKIASSIDEDGISLHGSERAIDVAPLRSRPANVRPPPPYGAKFANSRPPPPAYDRLTPTIGRFSPALTSTPKPNGRLVVPPEGEERPLPRDRADRNAKAQSFYDNAHDPAAMNGAEAAKPNGASEVWVGLGCL